MTNVPSPVRRKIKLSDIAGYIDIHQGVVDSSVERISKDFDPLTFGTLVVAEREDGKFDLIDGVQRVEAVRYRAHPDAEMEAWVYPVLSREAQGWVFFRLNIGSVGPSKLSDAADRAASSIAQQAMDRIRDVPTTDAERVEIKARVIRLLGGEVR